MKSVSDFIRLVEDAAAVNVVSAGAIATKDVPLGKIAKRKTQESAGTDPMAHIYAPDKANVEIEDGATPEDAEAKKKHMFHQKQQAQSDQTLSYD